MLNKVIPPCTNPLALFIILLMLMQLGLTCLAKACIEGNNKIVEILLAAGADINLPDEVL